MQVLRMHHNMQQQMLHRPWKERASTISQVLSERALDQPKIGTML